MNERERRGILTALLVLDPAVRPLIGGPHLWRILLDAGELLRGAALLALVCVGGVYLVVLADRDERA